MSAAAPMPVGGYPVKTSTNDVAAPTNPVVGAGGGGTKAEYVNSGTGDNTATPPSFTGDFLGQVAVTHYGRLWWWNGIGWRSDIVISGGVTVDGIRMAGTDSNHLIAVGSTTVEIDNCLELRNKHNNRHSAVRFTDLDGNEKGALGYGNPGANALFASHNYCECYATQDWRHIGGPVKLTRFKLEGSTGDFVIYDDSSAELLRADASTSKLVSVPHIGIDANTGVRFDTVDNGRVLFYTNSTLAGYFDSGAFATPQIYVSTNFTCSGTNTAGGTTGAQTIDKPSGSVNFAAGATTLVVTNNLVTTASKVFPVVETDDATATIKNVVCSTGSFTIKLTAAATAETKVGFFVVN